MYQCFPTKKGTWVDKNVGGEKKDKKKKKIIFNLDKTHRAQTYLQAPKTNVKTLLFIAHPKKAQGFTFSLFLSKIKIMKIDVAQAAPGWHQLTAGFWVGSRCSCDITARPGP